MRILLVEDDPLLGDGIQRGLRQEGYAVDWARDGESGQLALQAGEKSYDLLLLDLGLPGKSGMSLLQSLRSGRSELPVMIITARDSVTDRIQGLDAGADDYLVKPFDLKEMAARIRALLRRRAGRSSTRIEHGELVLDPEAQTLTRGGKLVELSPREFLILRELLENTGRVLSRERLEESLYGWDEEPESNAIEVHIHHLRKKLWPELIKTIRGVGYIVEKAVG